VKGQPISMLTTLRTSRQSPVNDIIDDPTDLVFGRRKRVRRAENDIAELLKLTEKVRI
jgi:hypothetical protein